MTSTTTHRQKAQPPAVPEAGPHPAVPATGALLFAAAAAGTVAGSVSMQDMGGVPMPGGWALSTAWLPMCGQSWAGAAASFTGMWAVMMVAMMLPALLPVLRKHRPGVAASAAAGYFFVWTALGAMVFVLGAALAQALLHMNALAHAAPTLSGLAVLLAGAFQFTAWKARHLRCCRQAPDHVHALGTQARTAWRHGVRQGLHCTASCAGLTLVLLTLGVMDLRAMALITAAIAAERLMPHGTRAARAIGAVSVVTGLLMMLRAAWPA